MRLSTDIVSRRDENQEAIKAKKGRSIVVTLSDSWGSLSVEAIRNLTGCPVGNFFKGVSFTDYWNNQGWNLAKTAILNSGSPSLLYMSLGVEDTWDFAAFPGRTPSEARLALSDLINRVHTDVRKIPIVHASYDEGFHTSQYLLGEDLDASDSGALLFPNLYEYINLRDVPVTFLQSDPLHLEPESYALRVSELWSRSSLAQIFGACSG